MTMFGEVASTLFYFYVGFFIICALGAGFFDWLSFHNRQPGPLRHFAIASHGAGIIALYVLFTGFPVGPFTFWVTPLRLVGAFFQAPQTMGALIDAFRLHPLDWHNWIPVVVFGWGAFWLCIGWRRAPRYRDGYLIARALIKIAAGVAGVWFGSQGVRF
jgi:hypothetical protein